MMDEKIEKEKQFDQLTDLYKTTVSSKDRDIDQLKNRVASLSEKRVKQDQSKVEDTLSLNRQSKLEEDFANFIDEARMDVRERIQAFFRSNENINVEIYYPRLACLIFEATYERMKEARKAIVEIFKEMSRGMIHSAPEMSRQFTLNEKARIPSFQRLRQNCNLDCFVEDVIQVVWSKWCSWHSKEKLFKLSPNTSLLRDPKILKYINACIRLTWRMVTQFPPLQIEYSSLYLKDIHMKKGYHSSPDMRTRVKGSSGPVQGEEIACYLWPGLLDGGGRLIRAGEVLCKIKDER
ncbi:hypothetical protein OS493_032612 [Desmophyllum pertusum]|uniref:Mitochondria-eating protein n=1 Tax=Desmophyllum pertusum TaxID=174260 RepID=A0A9W9YJC7_9CNID|nr:hypothetical protein OS493_032612 [Desmophyllum pertusum]